MQATGSPRVTCPSELLNCHGYGFGYVAAFDGCATGHHPSLLVKATGYCNGRAPQVLAFGWGGHLAICCGESVEGWARGCLVDDQLADLHPDRVGGKTWARRGVPAPRQCATPPPRWVSMHCRHGCAPQTPEGLPQLHGARSHHRPQTMNAYAQPKHSQAEKSGWHCIRTGRTRPRWLTSGHTPDPEW